MSLAFHQIGETYYLRLDPGAEVVDCLRQFAAAHDIAAASFSGFGAVKAVTLGFFQPDSKLYQQRKFQGTFEITSLLGNVSRLETQTYVHAHGNFSGADFQVFGGHLVAATVSATVEICLRQDPGELKRRFDAKIGLNIYDF